MANGKQALLDELLLKARNAGMPPLQVQALSRFGQDPEPFLQSWLARQSTENDAYREKERNRQRLEALAARVSRDKTAPIEVPGLTPEIRRGQAPLTKETSPGAAIVPAVRRPQTEDDERRLRLLRAARIFREGASQFRNITSPGELLLTRKIPDRSVRDEDIRAEEERVRGRIEEKRIGGFNNPDSPASVFIRDVLRESGFKVPDTLTATQGASLSPVVKTYLDAWVRKQSVEQQRRDAAEAEAKEGTTLAKPTAKEVGDVVQINQTITAIENLLAEKPEFNTGPLINAFQSVLNFVGAGEGPFGLWDISKKNAFKSNVADMLAQYMKSISGVAISEAEAKRLQDAFPKPSDDDNTFMRKGQAALKRLKEKRKVFLDTLEQAGKDVSALRGTETPAEQTPTSDQSAQVMVRGSDGGTYPAPRGAKVGDTFRLTPDGESISVVEVLDG